jgi:hypothetical protein
MRRYEIDLEDEHNGFRLVQTSYEVKVLRLVFIVLYFKDWLPQMSYGLLLI